MIYLKSLCFVIAITTYMCIFSYASIIIKNCEPFKFFYINLYHMCVEKCPLFDGFLCGR